MKRLLLLTSLVALPLYSTDDRYPEPLVRLIATDDPIDTSRAEPPEEILASVIYQIRTLRRETPWNHHLPRSEKYLKKALQAFRKAKCREETRGER